MFDIILANEGLWINIIIPFAIGLFLLFTHKEYVITELLAQVVLSVGILMMVYFLFFRYTTDLYSENYYNGYIKQFEHYDDYTSIETYPCGTAKAPRTCTRTVHHPDEYYVVTTNNHQIRVNKSNWRYAKNEFGRHSNSIFGGPKVRFSQSWGGSEYFALPTRNIPASSVHSEINYVKATVNNIVKANTFKEEITRGLKDGSLKQYPSRVSTPYGKIRLNRILGGGTKAQQLEVDKIAGALGRAKQVNPLIYVVHNQPRDFVHTLKSYWEGGRKNDAILILNMKDGKVDWSDTIAWTKNADFLVNATKVYKGKNLDEVIPMFRSEILLHFVREPMKNYKYLEDEISLSIYAQLAIILLNLIGSFFLFRYFLRN